MTPSIKGSVIERPQPGRNDLEQQPLPGNADSPDERSSGAGHGSVSGQKSPDSENPGSFFPDDVVGEGVAIQEKLVVSPCAGRFHAGPKRDRSVGEFVLEGQEVGRILSSNREELVVRTPFSGWIMGYLVPEGSPVREAEPVAWLRPH